MCSRDDQGNKTKDCGMCNCGSSDKAGSHTPPNASGKCSRCGASLRAMGS